jgi:hypothetical protein
MARFKRYRRRYNKRNAERVIRASNSSVAESTQQVAYTWTAVEACTVKSIRLDTGAAQSPGSVSTPYVLVRVPEGYNANAITYPALTSDMYNPTDLVLISGILTDGATEDHKSNFIGRKMKAGDRLALIFFNAGSGAVNISFEINFSVLT